MECLGCGYNLAGLGRSQCPECGRWFDPADRRTYGPALPEAANSKDRVILAWAVITGIWPVATVGIMYLARVAGWITLGHWPRVSADDPMQIGQLVDVLYALGWLAAMGGSAAFTASLYLVVIALLRGRWRTTGKVAALVAGGWVAALVLASGSDTVEWFMD